MCSFVNQVYTSFRLVSLRSLLPVTALPKDGELHTCEISRYYHFALCSNAPHWMCTRSRQHEVLTRAKWILASTGDAGPTFNRHSGGVGLWWLPAVKHCQTSYYQQTRGVEQVLVWCWASVAVLCCWECWQATLCFAWPAPMAHSYRLGLVTWGYQVRIPVGTGICHRGCAYTVL